MKGFFKWFFSFFVVVVGVVVVFVLALIACRIEEVLTRSFRFLSF